MVTDRWTISFYLGAGSYLHIFTIFVKLTNSNKSYIVMKRLVFIIALVMATSVSAFAQYNDAAKEPVDGIEMGMKYKQLKNLYNYSQYKESLDDRYSPVWSGVASFLIPGLGQMISNELGRGFAWFGGAVASTAVFCVGSGLTASAALIQQNPDMVEDTDINTSAYMTAGTIVSLVGSLALLAVDVCAIVDAVRVAKVKNMYEQDLRQKYSLDVQLHPTVNYVKTSNGVQPTAGFTLALNF